jgi:predicted Zn-dependent peptidase
MYILSDMMMNSVFNREECVKEKKVVIEENLRSEDQVSDRISDIMDGLIYNGSGFSFPIDDIEYHLDKKHPSLKYDMVVDMYRQFYCPDRIVLSIVSHIPFETIKRMLERSFFVKPVRKHDIHKYSDYIPLSLEPQTRPNIVLKHKSGIGTTHISIGFRTCSQINTDKYTLNLLKHVLGGTMSGRLFTLLRNDNGLTYSSNVYTQYYENMGDFTINTLTDPDKIIHNGTKPGVLPIIINLLNDLIKHGITQKELAMAKGNIKGKMAISLEDCKTQAQHNGEHALIFPEMKIDSYIDIYKMYYDHITLTQVKEVISKYFIPVGMNVCLLGETVPAKKTVYAECNKLISNY